MARSILRRTGLIALILVCGSVLSGCESVKDAWDSRGVPKQWEPD